MPTWTSAELTRIGTTDELRIAGMRSDGTLRKPVIIWVVRYGDALYVRSVGGRDAAWFRGAQVRLEGHIGAGGVEKDVTFSDADPTLNDDLDDVYRAKYHRGPSAITSITRATARTSTIKLEPR